MAAKQQKIKGQTISVRFLGDRDNDLIEWWAELEPGRGSEEIKTALRKHLGQAVPDQANELALLRRTVDHLLSEVQALSQQISQGIAMAPVKSAHEELSQQEIEQRSALLRKAGW